MAYDRYDRGDNPFRLDLDTLDMPRARPTAKPGAGRVAAAAPAPKKKKKPAVPLPPRRPTDLSPPMMPRMETDGSRPLPPAAQPSEGPFPPDVEEMTSPRTTIPTGLLSGAVPPAREATIGPTPPVPGYVMPENARRAMGGIFDTGPVMPPGPEAAGPAIPPGLFSPNPGYRPPANQRGGVFDTGPSTPLAIPDFLRRLFGGA